MLHARMGCTLFRTEQGHPLQLGAPWSVQCALAEAARIKLLFGALRVLFRASASHSSRPIVADLKA
eukprot:7335043-Prorocentrum_lima.AAC.1